jgi:gluconokinase
MQSTTLANAVAPLVLAIDIGTSSVRALLFDASARQIDHTESQHPWSLTETVDGGLVGDSDFLVSLVCQTIDECLDRVKPRAADIGAVGVSSFWHSLQCLDEDRRPVGPLLMWIDNRSRAEANRLREDVDRATRMRRETGCRPHSSYWPAKLEWLANIDPVMTKRASSRVSFADYLMFRLCGELLTSVAMASGTGLLDVRRCEWHGGIASRFGVTVDSLPELVDREQKLPALLPTYRQRWPQLANVPWFPAIGDGAAANVGAGCVGADRIAMTIGTSAAMRIIVPQDVELVETPAALWEYRLDRHHRVLGGALSNGGNVTAWLADLLAGESLESLTREADLNVQPDGHGLIWLPFLAGERSPSWNDDAFGTLLGLRFATTKPEIFRAALEGISYRLAMVYDDLRRIASSVHEVHANGGAALNSPLWMSIIADTFNHRIDAMDADAEVSARGAAICALTAIGEWESVRPGTIQSELSFEPEPQNHPTYRRALERQIAYEKAITAIQWQHLRAE